MFEISKAAKLNQFVEGGQLYCSPLVRVPHKNQPILTMTETETNALKMEITIEKIV